MQEFVTRAFFKAYYDKSMFEINLFVINITLQNISFLVRKLPNGEGGL